MNAMDLADPNERPTTCVASSLERFHRPDYRARKHSRPVGKVRQKWERHERKQWVPV